jgi:hypothetical protein
MNLTGNDYSVAFADLYNKYDGLLRPAQGDNRPLPMRRKSTATPR